MNLMWKSSVSCENLKTTKSPNIGVGEGVVRGLSG